MGIYFGLISSFFSLSSRGLYKNMKVEENRIKEQIAINGGIIKLKNLTLLFNPNFNFLGILFDMTVFFIVTLEDSFN